MVVVDKKKTQHGSMAWKMNSVLCLFYMLNITEICLQCLELVGTMPVNSFCSYNYFFILL